MGVVAAAVAKLDGEPVSLGLKFFAPSVHVAAFASLLLHQCVVASRGKELDAPSPTRHLLRHLTASLNPPLCSDDWRRSLQTVCVGYGRACRHSSLPRDGMISIASEATSPVRLGWTSDALKKKLGCSCWE
ncbi:hypothetical protein L1887_49671 [Cichorium endivia]|nr:hypothetical protein L1887_49671 [Cichorium endivia]